MSKQSEAKEKQGYTRDLNMCSNCTNYLSRRGSAYFHAESKLRCKIGGFKIFKTATCDCHDRTK